MVAIVGSLAGVCAGFFAVHAAAAGSLNRRLVAGRGRANSLYVLFYYLGGSIGITVSGHAYGYGGWRMVTVLGILMLGTTFAAGITELRAEARKSSYVITSYSIHYTKLYDGFGNGGLPVRTRRSSLPLYYRCRPGLPR